MWVQSTLSPCEPPPPTWRHWPVFTASHPYWTKWGTKDMSSCLCCDITWHSEVCLLARHLACLNIWFDHQVQRAWRGWPELKQSFDQLDFSLSGCVHISSFPCPLKPLWHVLYKPLTLVSLYDDVYMVPFGVFFSIRDCAFHLCSGCVIYLSVGI